MVAAVAAVAVAIGIFMLVSRDDDGSSATRQGDSTTTAATQDAAVPAAPASEGQEPAARGSGETAGDAGTPSPSSMPAADQAPDASQEARLEPDAPDTGQGDQPAEAGVRPPSFDVVRVEKSGEAVIAGQAPPKSDVTIFDNGETLGALVSEPTGAWVFIPQRRLIPGTHDLSLRARLGDGRELWSEESLVILVPEPEVAVASASNQPSEEGGEAGTSSLSGALVVVVPNAEGEASTILQQPEPAAGSGLGDGDLVLQSIDYDSDGNAVISGSAAPGARILAYLDDELIGAATSDQSGHWVVRPQDPIAPGLHRLRIDQIGPDGAVMARVESPFARAGQAEAGLLLRDGSVVVQPGNSLWRIARRVYGRGISYSVIYQANATQIGDPDLIYPGQIFTLPEAQE
jgi:hypothetical protein